MITMTFLLLAMLLSLRQRIREKRRVHKHEIPEHTKPSLLSEALQELIATAGGIYLSLVLLISFLQIEIADKWVFFDVSMDPLAMVSIILAIIQPFVLHVLTWLKGGR